MENEIFFARARKTSLTFLKTKFLLRAKSIVSALELPFRNTVKHQKRTKTRKVILKKPRDGHLTLGHSLEKERKRKKEKNEKKRKV